MSGNPYIESPLDQIVNVHFKEPDQPPGYETPGSISFDTSGGAATVGGDVPEMDWAGCGGTYGITGQQGSCIHAAEGFVYIGISDGALVGTFGGAMNTEPYQMPPFNPLYGGSCTGFLRAVEHFPNAGAVLAMGSSTCTMAEWPGKGPMVAGEFTGSFNADRGRQGMALEFQWKVVSADNSLRQIASVHTYPAVITLTVSVKNPAPPPHFARSVHQIILPPGLERLIGNR